MNGGVYMLTSIKKCCVKKCPMLVLLTERCIKG